MKQYFKRLAKYLLHGIPQNNISVNITKTVSGEILKDHNILITGGGSGIGLAIARRCAEEGANVIIVGRNEKRLREAASTISNCKIIPFDLTEIDLLPDLLAQAEKLIGQDIDSLVLNAGISLHEDNIEFVTIEGYEKQFTTNLESTYFLAKEFVNKRKDKKSNLLFISSERGFQCDDVPYGLTKCSINSLTRGLSRRFYRNGIRVNAIAPGITTSNMTGVKDNDNLALNRVVSGRVFIADEIAEVALFLLSDASMCISGEIIACDAGEYISSYF